MARTWLAYTLSVALALGVLAGGAQAGKGGFSGGGRSFGGGRSYSSGGHSFSGKSYSSGGRSFGGGRSYSSGSGFSKPSSTPRPTFSKPSPGAKTYSSGPPSPAGGKTAPAAPPRPPSGYTSPSGKSYVPWSPSPKPAAGPRRSSTFDASAAAAQRRVESRAQFTKGRAPEKTYTDPRGTAHPVDPTDRRVEELRRQLDHERWVNRELRNRQVFEPYYTRPVVVYHDPYSSYFWWWLLDQNLNTRAMWAYNHRSVMDDARYQQLLAHDAQLAARVQQLEAQGVPPNPAAAPPGLDPDLMYTDSYVTSVYNPQPGPGASPGSVPPPSAPPVVVPVPGVTYHAPGYHLWHGLRVLMYALLVIGVIVLVIWLVFFKRWGA